MIGAIFREKVLKGNLTRDAKLLKLAATDSKC